MMTSSPRSINTRIFFLVFSVFLVLKTVSSSINFQKNNQITGYFAVEKRQSTKVSVNSPPRIKRLINFLAKEGRDLPISTLYIGFGVLITTTLSAISIFNRVAAVLLLKTVTIAATTTAKTITILSILFEIPYAGDIFYRISTPNAVVADSKLNALVQKVSRNSGLSDSIKKVYLIKTDLRNANAISIGSFSAIGITQVSSPSTKYYLRLSN